MTRPNPAPGQQMLARWQQLSRLPFGNRVFSWMVGRTAPYTGSVGGVYTALRPGFAQVQLRDRRGVRNHLASVHAVALVNLAEMTSGAALLTALPTGVRGIVTGLRIEYLKKARGTLVATTTAVAPAVLTSMSHDVHATISDADGQVVAACTVTWRLSRRDDAHRGVDHAAAIGTSALARR